MVELDGLVAGLAVAADIDHPAVGHIGGGVGDRVGAIGRVAAVDGDAGGAGLIGQPVLVALAIGAAIGLDVAAAPAAAAAVPDPLVIVMPEGRRVQQDAEVRLDLLVDLGGDRIGRGRDGGHGAGGHGQGGQQGSREAGRHGVLPSAGSAWLWSEARAAGDACMSGPREASSSRRPARARASERASKPRRERVME